MKKILIFTALFVLVLGTALPAGAITFGQSDNNGHPNVGALVYENAAYCSGTLIDSQVFLTAAHCGIFGSIVQVSFDSGPPFTNTVSGTFIANPDFDLQHHKSDTGDIAVVLLDSDPTITPANLPTAGLLDDLKEMNVLRGQTFTAVGYGVVRETKSGGPSALEDNNTRMFSTSRFNALNKAWLRLSGNPALDQNPTIDEEIGGTCYGDSGGPNFLGGTTSNMIVAITITGDVWCRATNVVYRLDTETARTFLEQYVTLP